MNDINNVPWKLIDIIIILLSGDMIVIIFLNPINELIRGSYSSSYIILRIMHAILIVLVAHSIIQVRYKFNLLRYMFILRNSISSAIIYGLLSGLMLAVFLKIPESVIEGDIIIRFKKYDTILSGILLFGLFGPISEEIIFRGIIYKYYRNRHGVKLALIIQAAVFVVLHMYQVKGGYGAYVFIAASGIVFGILYEITDNIISPIICHSIVNIL